jgi:energy-coupling factor transporter transmembrane protein EcfT
MKKLSKIVVLLLVSAFTASVVVSTAAEARGRTGSHRSGGYNSHGKGSHYYGGH